MTKTGFEELQLMLTKQICARYKKSELQSNRLQLASFIIYTFYTYQ